MFSKKYVNSFSVFLSFFLVATTLSTVVAKGGRNSRKNKKRGRNEMEDDGIGVGYVALSIGAVGFFALGYFSSYVYNGSSTGAKHKTTKHKTTKCKTTKRKTRIVHIEQPKSDSEQGLLSEVANSSSGVGANQATSVA